MMANRTRGARGGFDLNRTLGQSPRHRLADSAETPKEKTLLAFLIWRGGIFLKKERVFFFRGFALQVFGQCGGAKCGTHGAKMEGFKGRKFLPARLASKSFNKVLLYQYGRNPPTKFEQPSCFK